MKSLLLSLLLTSGLASVPAMAITFEVYNGSSLYQTLTPTYEGTVGRVAKYSLNYTRNNYKGVVTLNIRGSTTEGIHYLNVTGNFNGPTAIDISGNGTGRIGAVDAITQYGGTEYVSVKRLYMVVDLGVGLGSSLV